MKTLKRLNRAQRIALGIYLTVAILLTGYLPFMFWLGWLAGRAP